MVEAQADVRLVEVALRDAGRVLALAWADGYRARFHARWLRDNAPDARTRDARSGQRLVAITALPADPRLSAAAPDGEARVALRFAPDAHRCVFEARWLRRHAYDTAQEPHDALCPRGAQPWDAGLAGRIDALAAAYAVFVGEPSVRRDWLAAVDRYGFGLLRGVPTERGAVARVAERFGYVRETNYGRWFDVRAVAAPENLAYTGLGLQVHTDNPYRDPVPTLQLLHCLANEAEGGESVVVDGLRACQVLRDEDRGHFDLLARHSAEFEFTGQPGVCLRARGPMIELTPEGALRAARFNNRSLAPLALPFETMEGYYAAYRHFAEILERPALAVSFRLAPGDLFVVDNTRVLHGRNAVTGAGLRHLQGCYAERDGLRSTLAVLGAAPAGGAPEGRP